MLEIIKQILEKEQIPYKKLTKSESGFSNLVYFIDELYVIKVLEPNGNEIKFTNEMAFYNTLHFDFIPKSLATGTYQSTKYIIMEKVEGLSLYEVWHTLSTAERKDITIQIATILKSINEVKEHDFLHKRYIRTNLITQYQNAFTRNIEIIKSKGHNTDFLETYKNKRVPIIFEEITCGLVYNDAHFDNFIYDGKTVKLIDFDRVLYTSIDYELLIINTMVNNPKKFANEKMEPYVKLGDYKDIIEVIKTIHKDLFNFTYLEERLYIYSFFYTLGNIYTFDLDHLIPEVLEDFKKKVFTK